MYRDVGKDNPDLRQFKAILATEIIKALDRDGLSVGKLRPSPGLLLQTFPVFVTLIWVVLRLIA